VEALVDILGLIRRRTNMDSSILMEKREAGFTRETTKELGSHNFGKQA
jgi:hypothetical protein